MQKYCSNYLRNPFILDTKKSNDSNYELIGFHNNTNSNEIDEPNESIIESQSVLIDFIDIESENHFDDSLINENFNSKKI